MKQVEFKRCLVHGMLQDDKGNWFTFNEEDKMVETFNHFRDESNGVHITVTDDLCPVCMDQVIEFEEL